MDWLAFVCDNIEGQMRSATIGETGSFGFLYMESGNSYGNDVLKTPGLLTQLCEERIPATRLIHELLRLTNP